MPDGAGDEHTTEFSSEKLALAMYILGEQFGDIVKAVGAAMLRRGQMTLTDLVRYVDMPGQKRRLGTAGTLTAESSRNARLEAQRERLLRESLMVLLHHNIVTCTPLKKKPDQLDTHISRLHIDDIVHRLSHPKYVEHVRSKFEGDAATNAELLVLSIFKQGKVSRTQAVAMALEEAKLLGGAWRKGGEEVVAGLEAAWEKLKADRYIVEGQTFSKIIDDDEDPDAAEYDSDGDGAASEKPGSKRKAASTSPKKSAKRRKPEAAGDSAAAAAEEEEDLAEDLTAAPLWRLDVELVRREMRHQSCITLVQHKKGDAYAELVKIMLNHNKYDEIGSTAEMSVVLPLEKLYDMLPKDGLISEWSSAQLEAHLEELYHDALEICVRTQDGGRWGWCVNLAKICQAIKQHCAGSVVRAQPALGEVGARIFRMLILQNKLEQKQIEKSAMVKMKEARTTLYKLFEKKYICLQEIARNAERKNSYYLFEVDFEDATRVIVADTFTAMLETCDRLEKYKKEFSEMLLEEDGAFGRTPQQNKDEKQVRQRISRSLRPLLWVACCCACMGWVDQSAATACLVGVQEQRVLTSQPALGLPWHLDV